MTKAYDKIKKGLDEALEYSQDIAQPWQETEVWKNESQYLTWLRGQFRKIWMDFIPKNEFLSESCFPVNNDEKALHGLHPKTKTAGKCIFCKKVFGKSKLQVDHKIPAGSMLIYEDAPKYLFRLLCSKDNMQLTCKPCHDIKSYADRHQVSFEEAGREKLAIAFGKWAVDRQKAYIQDVLGLKLNEVSNAKARRQAYRESLD